MVSVLYLLISMNCHIFTCTWLSQKVLYLVHSMMIKPESLGCISCHSSVRIWGGPLLSLRRRQWHPTPVLLPGKSHGWRSLVGCSLWGRSESDTTEWLHFHFSLSTFMHWRRKWQPTPVFLPGESPWTEEPGGLQIIGSQRVGHDWSDLACTHEMVR